MNLNFLIILSFLLACSSPKERILEGILSQKEFANILKEIHLVEGVFELQKTNSKEGAQNALSNCYQTIFSSHNINETIFQKTLEYYANHPSELEEIYADVIEGITEERSTLNPQ
jgi:hypothetical protein